MIRWSLPASPSPPNDECRTATSFTVPVAGFVRQPWDTGDALDVDLRRRGAALAGPAA